MGKKTYLELVGGQSAKFWEIDINGATFTVRFGRLKTSGQTKTKSFASTTEARAQAEKLITAKRKKGYTEASKSGQPSKASRRQVGRVATSDRGSACVDLLSKLTAAGSVVWFSDETKKVPWAKIEAEADARTRALNKFRRSKPRVPPSAADLFQRCASFKLTGSLLDPKRLNYKFEFPSTVLWSAKYMSSKEVLYKGRKRTAFSVQEHPLEAEFIVAYTDPGQRELWMVRSNEASCPTEGGIPFLPVAASADDLLLIVGSGLLDCIAGSDARRRQLAKKIPKLGKKERSLLSAAAARWRALIADEGLCLADDLTLEGLESLPTKTKKSKSWEAFALSPTLDPKRFRSLLKAPNVRHLYDATVIYYKASCAKRIGKIIKDWDDDKTTAAEDETWSQMIAWLLAETHALGFDGLDLASKVPMSAALIRGRSMSEVRTMLEAEGVSLLGKAEKTAFTLATGATLAVSRLEKAGLG